MPPQMVVAQGAAVLRRVSSHPNRASVAQAAASSSRSAACSILPSGPSYNARLLGLYRHRHAAPYMPITDHSERVLGITNAEYGGGGSGGYGGGMGGNGPGPQGDGSLPWGRSLLAIFFYLTVLLLVRLVYLVYKEAEELEEEITALYFLYSLATSVAALWPWARRVPRERGDAFSLEWDRPQMPDVNLSAVRNQVRDVCERVWVNAKAIASEGGSAIRFQASRAREWLPWLEAGADAELKKTARNKQREKGDSCDSKNGDEEGVKGVVAMGAFFLLSVAGLKVLCEEEEKRLDGGEGNMRKGKRTPAQAAAPPVACDSGTKK